MEEMTSNHRATRHPGRHQSERPADFNRNRWPTSIGMPGRHHRNPQGGIARAAGFWIGSTAVDYRNPDLRVTSIDQRGAPIPAVRGTEIERQGSTHSSRSLPPTAMPAHAPFLPFAIPVGIGCGQPTFAEAMMNGEVARTPCSSVVVEGDRQVVIPGSTGIHTDGPSVTGATGSNGSGVRRVPARWVTRPRRSTIYEDPPRVSLIELPVDVRGVQRSGEASTFACEVEAR